jgi:2-polyprenyl-3-methyl-5-hydroxy-6-metoxy-1,4-benzoquinol methylase
MVRSRSHISSLPAPPALIPVPGSQTPVESQADRQQWYRLWWRLANRVPLRRKAVSLGGEAQFPWTEVVSPEEVLEESVARSDLSAAEADPFWATLWRAYRGLVQYLCQMPLQGMRILEVGCGQGAMGIATALYGAEVTLSDSVSNALLVAQIHAWPVRHRVRVRRLRWGIDRCDGERFPIIAGSDVLYEPLAWDDLMKTAEEHLEPDGQLLFSEPPRYTGERFIPWMTDRGWDVRVVWIDLKDGLPSIRIFICRRAK